MGMWGWSHIHDEEDWELFERDCSGSCADVTESEVCRYTIKEMKPARLWNVGSRGLKRYGVQGKNEIFNCLKTVK